MERLNEKLYELGITKVKLAKILGVSRQMIYNYLELDDLNKWPKDKKVIILNLLDIKSPDELNDIKVDTDYIMKVESKINTLFVDNNKLNHIPTNDALFAGIGKKQKEIMTDIIAFMREKFDDNDDMVTYNSFLYLYHFYKLCKFHPN